jgi:hypothetical protein
MADSQPHEMQLVRTHTSGAEEWYCPTCGRRFLMHWPPTYKKIVLEVGDEYAAHVGGKGAAQLGSFYGYGEPQREQPGAAPFGTSDETEDDLFASAKPAATPARARSIPVEEVGPVPLTDELRPWLRWMCAAGLADEAV